MQPQLHLHILPFYLLTTFYHLTLRPNQREQDEAFNLSGLRQMPLEKVWILLFSYNYRQRLGQTGFFSLGKATSLWETKLWIQTSCTLFKDWTCVTYYLTGIASKLTLCCILTIAEGLSKYLQRQSRCNGYCCRKWTWQPEFKF